MVKRNAPIRAKADTVRRPKPFGGMGKSVDDNSFSDGFPTGMQVSEAD
jgi:hypothetical protein